MTLDQRLTRAVHHVADTVIVPEVDLDAIHTSARANRRRTVAVGAAAVVVALIAVGVTVLGGRDTSKPAPAEPVPSPHVVGRGPVWYDAAGLHHGDVVEQTRVELIGPDSVGDSSGTLALVRGGALYRGPATGDVWFHPWGGEPRVIGHGSWAGPGGDPEGDVGAWFEASNLVVYDTARGREISRTVEAQVFDRAGGEHLIGGGNGFLHVSAEEVVWRSRFAVHRLDLATGRSSTLYENLRVDDRGSEIESNPQLEDVHEGSRVWGPRAGPVPMSVDVAGHESLQLPGLEPTGRLSADGSFLLAPEGDDGTHGAAIVDLHTGETWKLRQDDFHAFISWAYDDVAVVKVELDEQTSGPLLACDADKRACEPLPHQGNVVLPTS